MDSEAAPLIQIYLYPVFDSIIYGLMLLANKVICCKAQQFSSFLNFFIQGYTIGMCLLVGIG